MIAKEALISNYVSTNWYISFTCIYQRNRAFQHLTFDSFLLIICSLCLVPWVKVFWGMLNFSSTLFLVRPFSETLGARYFSLIVKTDFFHVDFMFKSQFLLHYNSVKVLDLFLYFEMQCNGIFPFPLDIWISQHGSGIDGSK